MNRLISISAKFDEYEPEQQEKHKLIRDMNIDTSIMNEKTEKLEEIVDKQKQHSRRNCLLLHGIAENECQNIGDLVLKRVNEKIIIELSGSDLDKKESNRK